MQSLESGVQRVKHEFSFLADSKAADDIVANVMQRWRMPPKMTGSEWAEKHFTHPKTGRLKLKGFQREILDCMTDRTTEKTTFLKAARTGATMCMSIGCTYFVLGDPAEVSYLLNTKDDCQQLSVDTIKPALEDTAGGKELMTTASRATLTHMVFNNGASLRLVPAATPRALRRFDSDCQFADEVDSYDQAVGNDGSPIELFFSRSKNSYRRKRVLASTPTIESTSQIWVSWLLSDQRYYFVKCPHCQHEQTIDWDRMCVIGFDYKTGEELIKPAEEVRSAYFRTLLEPEIKLQCCGCDQMIDENHKVDMVNDGRWIAQAPHVTGHAGFQVSALYSDFPECSWPKLLQEWLLARTPADKQVFYNNNLGIPFQDRLNNLDPEKLAKRKGDFSLDKIPEAVLLITAGVDIQQDRAEVTRLGWSADGQIYILDHRKIYGSPTGSKLWAELDADLALWFDHPLGGRLGTAAAAIDSGAFTTAVYQYCGGKQDRGIYAIKGVAGPKPLWSESNVNIKQGEKLYSIGVDQGKRDWIEYLGVENTVDEGYVHISGTGVNRESTEYFEQIVAEVQQVKYRAGKPVVSWIPKSNTRSEGMDCAVYSLAARSTLSPNWDLLRDHLTAKWEPDTPAHDPNDFSDL